jgi:uncharacterized membrane protein
MWSLILIQWLHVFSGICWFGSILYLDFVVIPAVMTLPLEQQRTVSKALAIFANRVLIPAALLATVANFLWGHFAIGRAARRLEVFPLAEVMKSSGTVALAFAAQVKRVRLLVLLELFGFFVIFTCMILMRFGL